MATQKKGNAKKSKKSNKKSNDYNFFTKFLLILLVLAMIVAAVFFTLNNFNINKADIKNKSNKPNTEATAKTADNKPTNKVTENAKIETEKTKNEKATTKDEVVKKEINEAKKENKKESKELKTLSGCWLSTEQGAFITIDEYGYRIDFSNVAASRPITGNYYIENNLITFIGDDDDCGETEGTYRITFYKKNISLSCKNDDCANRRNILEADWEWVEY